MKILGIIPARGGSKGVPRKNIKLLNGKPLLQYTLESAKESKLLHSVILSSEDDEIIKVSEKLGLESPFKRPLELASDKSTSLSVIQHALNFYIDKGVYFDAVCLLQVTSPFRKKGLLDKAIKKFIDLDADSLVSVLEIPHEYNPHWAFKANDNGFLKIATGEEDIITRRQDLPMSYHRDGSIYITKTRVILEDNSLYGKKITFIENDLSCYVNIDTILDWEKAELLAVSFKK